MKGKMVILNDIYYWFIYFHFRVEQLSLFDFFLNLQNVSYETFINTLGFYTIIINSYLFVYHYFVIITCEKNTLPTFFILISFNLFLAPKVYLNNTEQNPGKNLKSIRFTDIRSHIEYLLLSIRVEQMTVDTTEIKALYEYFQQFIRPLFIF